MGIVRGWVGWVEIIMIGIPILSIKFLLIDEVHVSCCYIFLLNAAMQNASGNRHT